MEILVRKLSKDSMKSDTFYGDFYGKIYQSGDFL